VRDTRRRDRAAERPDSPSRVLTRRSRATAELRVRGDARPASQARESVTVASAGSPISSASWTRRGSRPPWWRREIEVDGLAVPIRGTRPAGAQVRRRVRPLRGRGQAVPRPGRLDIAVLGRVALDVGGRRGLHPGPAAAARGASTRRRGPCQLLGSLRQDPRGSTWRRPTCRLTRFSSRAGRGGGASTSRTLAERAAHSSTVFTSRRGPTSSAGQADV